MKPKDRKVLNLKVDVPVASFPSLSYFDVFSIESLGSDKLVFFGLRQPKGILKCWACCLDGEMLGMKKHEWLEYLLRIGKPEAEAKFQWKAELSDGPLPYCNLVAWSRRGESGEIRCSNFAIGDVTALEQSKGREKDAVVKAQPLALLRSPVEVQRQLLVALYDDLLL